MSGITQEVQADAAFGTDLYSKLAATGNVVFSPASIAAALRMALTGARGDTAAELAAALHLAGPRAAADGLARLAGIRPGGDVTFRAPNMMWLETALSVRDSFISQLSDTVTVRRCDFIHAPEAARQAINDAVADQTVGKIANLIPPGLVDQLTRLVLTSAVYLKARWESQFPADATRQRPFYPERAEPAVTDLMHLEASLTYHRGDGYQAVLLPYRGGSLAMAAVLPDGPLSEFPGHLGRSGGIGGPLAGLLSDGTRCQVDLSLPRFRVDAGFVLKDTLEALGVRAAFIPGTADFTGITEDDPLYISAVVHKAYIDVGEEGTEAAAATGVTIRALSLVRKPPPDVRLVFDRPFLFAIVETGSGLPLFLGQFTRPR